MNGIELIPEITDKIGRHWTQPPRESIEFSDGRALMSRLSFDRLADYSLSNPSGIYAGKMWKRLQGVEDWYLCWYTERSKTPGIFDLHHRLIEIVGEGLRGLAGQFSTLLIDPPWRFSNSTGKISPEHKRLARYRTMSLEEICRLPVAQHATERSHLYLWVPNALLPDGLQAMAAWGFTYKSNLVWYKVRQDGGPDSRGVGFYFRNVTELVLFGTRAPKRKTFRTLAPHNQVNLFSSRKREHSRKPDELYSIIERKSPGPFLELFARGAARPGWTQWGDEAGKESA